MASKVRWTILILTFWIPIISSSNGVDIKTFRMGKYKNETMKTFMKKLFDDYDSTIPPSMFTGKTVDVNVGIYVHAISGVSERSMDYSVNMFLRQYWTDERLAFRHLGYNASLTLNSMKDKMWVPDLYFINEKEGSFHMVTTPNLLLRLSPDGDVTFSQKLTVKLSCPMKLKKFPMDTQNCEIKIESYGYTTLELMFHWIKGTDKNGTPNAVQFSELLELPEFEHPKQHMSDCTMFYLTGSYSCLKASFVLKRKFGYYLIQTYIPSVLIVILSWVSFWIDVQAVPARISLGLLTVLSMTTQSSGARGQLPRVSYIKAIDVWMSTCLVFVFGGLIEYAIANVLAKRHANLQRWKELKDILEEDASSALINSKNSTQSNQRQSSLGLNYKKPIFQRYSSSSLNVLHATSNTTGNIEMPTSNSRIRSASYSTDLFKQLVEPTQSSATSSFFQPPPKYLQSPIHRQVDSSCSLNNHFGVVRHRSTNSQRESPPSISKASINTHHRRNSVTRRRLISLSQEESHAEMIDRISRAAFPISFLLFNFGYWLYYLYILD